MVKSSKLSKEIYRNLINYNNIVFGPLLGELGWEVCIWAGFIRKYKLNNPHKKIIVATRENRQDLYTNCVDDIITFNIKSDYSKLSPRTNKLKIINKSSDKTLNNLTSFDYLKLLDEIKEKVQNNNHKEEFLYYTKIIDFPFSTMPQFTLDDLDFNFNPRFNNNVIIDNIIKNYPNKIPITIYPRHREDLSHRNWDVESWNNIFQLISDTNKYLVFISGSTPGYVKPKITYPGFIVLEDIVDESSSLIGLTIEAINKSKFCFGMQTFGTLLSNVLKKPHLFIGMEQSLIKNYNPFNTKFHMIPAVKNGQQDKKYVIDYNDVFKEFIKFDNTN